MNKISALILLSFAFSSATKACPDPNWMGQQLIAYARRGPILSSFESNHPIPERVVWGNAMAKLSVREETRREDGTLITKCIYGPETATTDQSILFAITYSKPVLCPEPTYLGRKFYEQITNSIPVINLTRAFSPLPETNLHEAKFFPSLMNLSVEPLKKTTQCEYYPQQNEIFYIEYKNIDNQNI